MIPEDSRRPPIADSGVQAESVGKFETAIAEVAELTLALNSASAKLAFWDGARIRGELERGLSHAQAVAEHLSGGSVRAEALRKLGDMQAIAAQALMIAPAPSIAALQAAKAGDWTSLRLEELAWVEGRMASGSSPRRPRRNRPKTQPASPKARQRKSLHVVSDAPSETNVAASTPDEAEPE